MPSAPGTSSARRRTRSRSPVPRPTGTSCSPRSTTTVSSSGCSTSSPTRPTGSSRRSASRPGSARSPRVAAAMTVDQPLVATLEQIRSEILRTTAGRRLLDRRVAGVDQRRSPARDGDGPGLRPRLCRGLPRDVRRRRGRRERRPTTSSRSRFWRGARTDALADPRYAPIHPFWSRPCTGVGGRASCSRSSRAGSSSASSTSTCPTGSRFGDDDADYLLAMADHAALAIQNAALFARAARGRRRRGAATARARAARLRQPGAVLHDDARAHRGATARAARRGGGPRPRRGGAAPGADQGRARGDARADLRAAPGGARGGGARAPR